MIGKKTSGFFKKSSREQIQFVSCSIIVMNWEYNFSNSRDYVEVTNIVFLHADIREKQQEGIHNRTGSSGSCELSCHLLFVAIRVSLRWLVLHSKKYAKKTAKNGVGIPVYIYFGMISCFSHMFPVFFKGIFQHPWSTQEQSCEMVPTGPKRCIRGRAPLGFVGRYWCTAGCSWNILDY